MFNIEVNPFISPGPRSASIPHRGAGTWSFYPMIYISPKQIPKCYRGRSSEDGPSESPLTWLALLLLMSLNKPIKALISPKIKHRFLDLLNFDISYIFNEILSSMFCPLNCLKGPIKLRWRRYGSLRKWCPEGQQAVNGISNRSTEPLGGTS